MARRADLHAVSLMRWVPVAGWLALLSAGACSRPAERVHEKKPRTDSTLQHAFAAPRGLSSAPSGGNVLLRWENHATAPGGYFVEFRTDPNDAFTMIDAVWADAQTRTQQFAHEDAARDTVFSYRVRPFFGATSAAAVLTTGAGVDAGAHEEEGPLAEPSPTGAVASLRDARAMVEAAPAELSATLASPTTAVLRWKDRARDEDGYLLEMAPADSSAFQICALLPPNTTSFRKVKLPPHTKMQFRARAYFLGTPSNETTASLR
ncbi:fibronectin type III domain-containing protein [Pendulispora brunnea]|uniref:Fibronectin type III domain-containing protein n=1 Tax=Pendulispora brunnea TaxID=2905690 RepID=A0ABZ2JZN4_9BACT